MKAGLFALSPLIVYFLVCSSEAPTNIRPEKIKAVLGQDVILPCKVPNNINIRAVEWIRPDQEPEYVLFYRDGRLDPYNQHPSYKDRVDLQDKDMKDGNFSLILKNAMKNDTGIYVCRVFEEGKIDPISNISLVVHLSAQTNIRHEKIPAVLGQNVILPCKVPNNISINITTVKWSRPGLDPDHVLFFRDEQLVPHNQHPSYQNRVDLQDKDMKDGDVSLILKNVTKNDTGTYECWVFEEGKIELICNITLEIHPPGDQVGIIVGSAVGMILLAVVGFRIYRQHTNKNPNLPVPPDDPEAKLML